ncbi:MAG: DNA adenine methylase, partial [Oscillospiraceae bacterium]
LSLIDFLQETISNVTGFKDGDNYVFADLFAGTGVVGTTFKAKGCKIIANDIQYYSYILNRHLIENNSPIDTSKLEYLNSLSGIDGFVYKNFCNGSGSERNYFSDSNGKKC